MGFLGKLSASPELGALAPADANELRLVLDLGRVKCLLGLERAEDAAKLIGEVFDAIAARAQQLPGAESLGTSCKLELTEVLALAGREAEAEAQVEGLNAEAEAALLQVAERRGLEGVRALLARPV